MKNNSKNKITEAFIPLMIDKISSLEKKFKQPWVDASLGRPRNIRGNCYGGLNMFFLLMASIKMKYEHLVFLTFKQAKSLNLAVNKGEKSVPIYYYFKYVFHKETRKPIDYKDYCKLSEAQKSNYVVIPKLNHYCVFNVAQTNMKEADAQLWESLSTNKIPRKILDCDCEEIDIKILNQEWLCPINVDWSGMAFYNYVEDVIKCPKKEQYPNSLNYYSVILHEMAHSTGHSSRLNRESLCNHSEQGYAYEELVAELAAAIAGVYLGLSTEPRDENAAYLKSWLSKLQQDPEFLCQVAFDASKAASQICEVLNIADTQNQD